MPQYLKIGNKSDGRQAKKRVPADINYQKRTVVAAKKLCDLICGTEEGPQPANKEPKQSLRYCKGVYIMAFKNIKRSAYFKPNGMRVNCDGTTVRDRKPNLKICPNHFKTLKRSYRIWTRGPAIRDGSGWYE